MLGEADVNISAMHLARTPPARGRVHDPGARRRRAGRPSPRRSGPRRRSSTSGRSGSGAGADRRLAPLIPDGLDATLVLVRHGESSSSSRAGSRARPRRRCRRPGGARRRSSPSASPAARSAGPAGPERPAARDRPLPARRDGRRPPTAIERRDPRSRRGRRPCAPTPGFLEIGQGDWEGLHRDEIAARYGRRARGLAAATARGLGARRRVAGRGPGAGPRRRWPTTARAPGRRRGPPGTLDRPQVAGYGDARRRPAVVDRRRPRRRLQGRRC